MRVTNTEVVNGVHPLHWAMSPGPSPMGTNPINGFKWYKWFWHQPQHLQKHNAGQEVFKTSSLELTNWTSKDKEAKL